MRQRFPEAGGGGGHWAPLITALPPCKVGTIYPHFIDEVPRRWVDSRTPAPLRAPPTLGFSRISFPPTAALWQGSEIALARDLSWTCLTSLTRPRT